jgi:DNA-binding LacI/PurR family transcriptional regulator
MNTGRSGAIGVISGNVGKPGFALALDVMMAVAAWAGVSVIVAETEYEIDLEHSALDMLLSSASMCLLSHPGRAALHSIHIWPTRLVCPPCCGSAA